MFGGKLGMPEQVPGGCSFHGSNGDDTRELVVSVLSGAELGGGVNDAFDALLHQTPQDVATPLQGLGDRADFVASPGNKLALVVASDGRIFLAGASNAPNPKLKTALTGTIRELMQSQ